MLLWWMSYLFPQVTSYPSFRVEVEGLEDLARQPDAFGGLHAVKHVFMCHLAGESLGVHPRFFCHSGDAVRVMLV